MGKQKCQIIYTPILDDPKGHCETQKEAVLLYPLLVSEYGCIWITRGRHSPSGAMIRRECQAISQIISEVNKWWSHHMYLTLCLSPFCSPKWYDNITCSLNTENKTNKIAAKSFTKTSYLRV